MWTLKKPTICVADTMKTCIRNLKDNDLKSRFKSAISDLTAAETIFDQNATSASLNKIKSTTGVAGKVTKSEMENLYARHMVRENSRGRDIYDQIMTAAPFDRCPFCGHRDVSTLDHYLPKSKHPAFALTPINLSPSCKDCNHNKGTAATASTDKQFINPYYDNIADEEWLFATIVEGAPPGAKFFTKCPASWTASMKARVENHFKKLELDKLYASQGARELQNMRGALQDIFNSAGSDAVKSDLERRFKGYSEIYTNSWEGALCKAAYSNTWYCSGGFYNK